jgi:hypothetical protein
MSLALVADGKLQSRQQLYDQIMRPLELIKNEARFLRSTVGSKRCRPPASAPLSQNVLRVGE